MVTLVIYVSGVNLSNFIIVIYFSLREAIYQINNKKEKIVLIQFTYFVRYVSKLKHLHLLPLKKAGTKNIWSDKYIFKNVLLIIFNI